MFFELKKITTVYKVRARTCTLSVVLQSCNLKLIARFDNGTYWYSIKIMMKIQHQLKLTNEASKEQQKEALTETQVCSILNLIQQFLQQY